MLLVLYDVDWTHLGVTGRSPGRWERRYRVYLAPFKIKTLITINGLYAPVFVTTDFSAECPCTEYSLNTFLVNGQFATATVKNGAVAQRDDEDECVCTI